MKEEWRIIDGTDGRLEVSSFGRIKSNLRNGRILKPTPDAKGYLRLRVTLDRVKYSYKVHREVAKAFIPNPNGYPQVNHIDGDKSNNRTDNLEWVSNDENAAHAIASGLWDRNIEVLRAHNSAVKTPIYSVDIVTGERRDFESISEAERFFNSRHIADVLHGKRQKASGQYFYYQRR